MRYAFCFKQRSTVQELSKCGIFAIAVGRRQAIDTEPDHGTTVGLDPRTGWRCMIGNTAISNSIPVITGDANFAAAMVEAGFENLIRFFSFL